MALPKILRLTHFKIAFFISLFFALLVLFVSGKDFNSPRLLGGSYMKAARFFRTFEYRAFDQKFFARGDLKPPYQVAIVAIDEKSVAAIGRWPWPRTTIARLIDQLKALDAKVIGLDLVFSEPDQLGTYGLLNDILARLDRVPKLDPELATVKTQLISMQGQWQLLSKSENLSSVDRQKILQLNALQGKAIDRLLDELSKQKDREGALHQFEASLRDERERVNADRILAESIAKAGNVVMGYFFLKGEEIKGLKNEQYRDFSTLENSKISVVMGVQDQKRAVTNLERANDFKGVRANIAQIAGENSIQGFFNAAAEIDGIFRRGPLLLALNQELYPSLDLLAVQQYYHDEGMGTIVPVFLGENLGLSHIRMNAPHAISSDENGWVYFNWYGRPGTIPTISVIDILEGKVEKERIQNRIVLVGPTAIAIADLRTTPYGENFPGVEMHATLVGNVLQNSYLKRNDYIYLLEVLFTLLAGILLGVILKKRRPLVGFLLTLVILAGLFYIDYYFIFPVFHVWVRSFWPMMGLIFVYLGITLHALITEEFARRQLKQTFNAYVSPSVVDQMLSNPDKFRLGGERKELTVFFSDIRGFSSISEHFEPEDLVQFINEYLTPMTNIVLQFDGTLDKYIGDAIMGFWGAPLNQPDHAERACNAALDMIRKLTELQSGWKKRELPAINVGVGINSGPMSVGNMGSESRFSYTVMGDAVNLASRLEGLCKEYGCNIIVGANTYQQTQKNFIFRPLDRVRVKGKAIGEDVYELMGKRLARTEEEKIKESKLLEIVKIYSEGLQFFWSRQWNDAELCFQKVIELRGGDKASEVFLEQIAFFQEKAPAPNWDGIRTMEIK